MKIVCVTCGDEKSIWPSIITHSSIKEHNQGLSHYIFYFGNYLSENCLREIEDKRINIIFADKEIFDKMNNFQNIHRYSKMIFLKYLIAPYFYKKNFDFMIDLDMDVLCLEKYNIGEILPKDVLFSYRPVKKLYDFCDEDTKKGLHDLIDINIDNHREILYPHGGFMITNLKIYCNYKIDELFVDIYKKINNLNFGCHIDEIIISLLNIKLNLNPIYLDRSYNENILCGIKIDSLKNVHFSFPIKPWFVKDFVKSQNYKIYNNYNIITYLFYIIKYIEYTKKFSFADQFLENELSIDMIINYIINREIYLKSKL